MTDLRDFSRLPDDPAYWADLESRIVAAAVSPGHREQQSWWQPLARGAWAFGGLAAAAALATLLLTPARQAAPAPTMRLLGAEVSDPALARFIAAPSPPDLTSLLVPPPGGSR